MHRQIWLLNARPPAIDVVKTRIQVDPSMARLSLLTGGRRIIAQEGPAALLTGFGPTAVGYLVQVRTSLCGGTLRVGQGR